MAANRTLRLDFIGSEKFNDIGTGSYDAGSFPTAFNVGDPVVHDDDASYFNTGTGGATAGSMLRGQHDLTFTEKMAAVVHVHVYARHERQGGSTWNYRNVIRLGGVNVILPTAGGLLNTQATYTTFPDIAVNPGVYAQMDFINDRPGGGVWVEADFKDSTIEWGIELRDTPGADATTRFTSIWLEIVYVPLNRGVDLEREVASRKLRRAREPEEVIKIVNGWEAFEGELMDRVAVSHAHGPTHDAKGWGLKDWERMGGILTGQIISLSMPRVQSTIGNRRRDQTTFWEVFKQTISGDADIADGIPRLDAAGADREYTRSSSAWIEEPGGVIKLILDAKEKIEPNGQLIEEARTNLVLESSFVNGTTGWTKTDTTGVTTFAAGTTNLLFDTDVTAKAGELTVTTAPYDSDITPAAPVLVASTFYTLSVDWEQDAAATTEVAIENIATGNWLQSDGGSWGASRVNITLGTEVGSKQRDTIGFTTEGSGTTHNVHVNVTGSNNGTVHTIQHVQIEPGPWASSRIVTEASAVTRAADFLTFENDSSLAQRIFPVDKFTCKIKVRPQWAPGDLAAEATILKLSNDASNWIRIYVAGDVANDPLRFEYRHGGATETAFIDSPLITADTEHEIVIRKVSSSAELDLAAGTIDVFLDGTIGTSDTAASDLTEAATSDLTLGSEEDGTLVGNCHLVEIMVSPIVFANAEISGGLP